jgi:hypothetical protein
VGDDDDNAPRKGIKNKSPGEEKKEKRKISIIKTLKKFFFQSVRTAAPERAPRKRRAVVQ